MIEDIFNDEFKNLVINVINRYKRYGDKYVFEFVKMIKSFFSDLLGRLVESIKIKVYRDFIFGLDIDIYLSNE